MSFESGRKLGITASLIAVIMPVIAVITAVSLILSIITSISSISSGTTPVTFSYFGVTIIALFLVGIISFVGFILFIVAMHSLSQYYNEPGIFKNTLYGFILNIVGVVIAGLVEFITLFVAIGHTSTGVNTGSADPTLPSSIFTIFAVFIAVFILGIVSAWLYKRAFNMLAQKSGASNFGTTGLLILVGTILSIVLVGGIIVWIAWIFALMGFLSLKPKAPETSTFAYSTSTPPSTIPDISQKRYCPYCGTENIPGSLYCQSCGKQLQ